MLDVLVVIARSDHVDQVMWIIADSHGVVNMAGYGEHGEHDDHSRAQSLYLIGDDAATPHSPCPPPLSLFLPFSVSLYRYQTPSPLVFTLGDRTSFQHTRIRRAIIQLCSYLPRS